MRQVPSRRALARYHGSARDGLRLFCFPHAGGAAASYRNWSRALGLHVDVVAVEYPGRGFRRSERPLTRVADIADALMPDIASEIGGPFALFGHSMGGLVVYELLRGLLSRGLQPACVIMSGCRPPSIPRSEPRLHELPDGEFIEQLRNLEGTPEELLADAELMSLAMPVLRADFEAVENYPQLNDLELACPVFSYGGMSDPNIKPEQLEGWRTVTRAQCTVRVFPGSHFFLHTHQDMLLSVLLRDVMSCSLS